MKALDCFALGLTGYLLALAVHSPIADSRTLTPEQALDRFEQQLEETLFFTPPSTHPPIHPSTPNTPSPRTTYITPTKGTLTSGYGWRWGRMHNGIDIAAPVGTPIVAAAAGTVVFSGWHNGGYGFLVEVRHNDGSITRYAHNSKNLVTVGQTIEQGQAIALMGSTGYSTGPHCHFEIILPGKGAVNPLAFLPTR